MSSGSEETPEVEGETPEATPSDEAASRASSEAATPEVSGSASDSVPEGEGELKPEAVDEDVEEAAPAKTRRRRKAVKAPEPVAEEAAEEEPSDDEEPEDEADDEPEAEAPAKPAPAAPRRKPRRDPNLPIPVVRAEAKYVRSSARKARLVCDNIRGKTVEDARAILAHTPRHVARDWSKLLESAVANAEHNHELVGEDLYIKAVKADEGPTIKRFQPRAMGRATQIRKRTSHLTILLTPKD
jgi:ribosomal protein L22